jgi:hypothetical protein
MAQNTFHCKIGFQFLYITSFISGPSYSYNQQNGKQRKQNRYTALIFSSTQNFSSTLVLVMTVPSFAGHREAKPE